MFDRQFLSRNRFVQVTRELEQMSDGVQHAGVVGVCFERRLGCLQGRREKTGLNRFAIFH